MNKKVRDYIKNLEKIHKDDTLRHIRDLIETPELAHLVPFYNGDLKDLYEYTCRHTITNPINKNIVDILNNSILGESLGKDDIYSCYVSKINMI